MGREKKRRRKGAVNRKVIPLTGRYSVRLEVILARKMKTIIMAWGQDGEEKEKGEGERERRVGITPKTLVIVAVKQT